MERATTFPLIEDAHRKAQSKTGSVGSYSANGAVIRRKKTTRKASLVVGGSADRHSARSVRPTLPLFHWSLRLFLTKPWKQQCNDKRGQSDVIVGLSFAVIARSSVQKPSALKRGAQVWWRSGNPEVTSSALRRSSRTIQQRRGRPWVSASSSVSSRPSYELPTHRFVLFNESNTGCPWKKRKRKKVDGNG